MTLSLYQHIKPVNTGGNLPRHPWITTQPPEILLCSTTQYHSYKRSLHRWLCDVVISLLDAYTSFWIELYSDHVKQYTSSPAEYHSLNALYTINYVVISLLDAYTSFWIELNSDHGMQYTFRTGVSFFKRIYKINYVVISLLDAYTSFRIE